MAFVSAQRLSEIIGWVYDCVIDPRRWPATMESICGELGFYSSVILLVDLRNGDQKYLAEWNTTPFYQEMMRGAAFTPDVAEIFERSRSQRRSIDEPMVLSRLGLDREVYRQSPMYKEWAKPQGLCDGLNVTVLDDPPHLATLAVTKREVDGDFSDGEIDFMRLLAPHIRRAVTISGLIDMKAIEAEMLSSTLNSLSVGVVLTNATAEIVHANGAAHEMISKKSPIRQQHGRLAASTAAGTAELRHAIDLAVSDEASIGGAGIGIPLDPDSEVPTAAHVLPLARGKIRPHLMPAALAAVFVTPKEVRSVSAFGRQPGPTG
jgi:hypothetical protein